MSTTKHASLALFVAILFAIALAACSSDKSDPEPTPDGDEESLIDGDAETNPEAEEAIESETESDTEAEFVRCTPAQDTLCFDVTDDSGSLAGAYSYVKHGVMTSGCAVSGSDWQIEMFRTAESPSSLLIQLTDYKGANTYTKEAEGLTVKWIISDDAANAQSLRTQLASFPCSLTLTDATQGQFDCTLIDMNDNSHRVILQGAFSCAAK